MSDEPKTGINKAWAEAELTKKKKSINIHPRSKDVKIPDVDDLELGDAILDEAKHKFIGEMFTIALVERGPKDRHICFEMFSEDDGFWHRIGTGTSSYWIDDLIDQLTAAKEHMKKNEYAKEGDGYEFKTQ